MLYDRLQILFLLQLPIQINVRHFQIQLFFDFSYRLVTQSLKIYLFSSQSSYTLSEILEEL